MSTTTLRATLIGSGEHAAAVCKLGDSYSPEQYLEALDLARATGAGERYADACLGSPADDSLTAVDQDIYDRAMTLLAKRGVHEPTYSELADALVQVTT
jgi:hypothetical protein